MAGSRELLDSLKPGMHLDKNFFLKVYGHEITRPGFAENVIKRLEILGCSKAREYYTCVVTEFEYKHPVATVAPTKLEDYKIHQDPPGISGELVEGRIVYDAFVLDNKKMAIYYVENKATE